MKRFILLAIFAVALFAVVPSHAACVSNLPEGAFACAEPYPPYEGCLWGETVVGYSDNCVDLNGDADYDLYVYGTSQSAPGGYDYDNWLSDGHVNVYDQYGPACIQGFVDLAAQDYDFGTC